eukprot:6188004-Pleurochrysis_carterae.AAC.3
MDLKKAVPRMGVRQSYTAPPSMPTVPASLLAYILHHFTVCKVLGSHTTRARIYDLSCRRAVRVGERVCSPEVPQTRERPVRLLT